MMRHVIEAEGLVKRYGATVALSGVSLAVRRGEIFGIVGPNGAGKTTLVESAVGLRRPDAGRVRVLGLDPRRDRDRLGQRIGVQLQEANLPDRLRVGEALDLFASFYRRPVPWEPLLERWGLAPKRRAAFADLSGGQKQRLFIALALLNDPEVVFLDEITTGLDPQARRETWELVRAVRDEGKTVVLVTHFMEEVEELCDRVAIVDRGRLVGLDAPRGLIDSLESETCVTARLPSAVDTGALEGLDVVSRCELRGDRLRVWGHGPLLVRVVVALHDLGVTPDDVHIDRPTLEDVFLQRTGRRLDEEGASTRGEAA